MSLAAAVLQGYVGLFVLQTFALLVLLHFLSFPNLFARNSCIIFFGSATPSRFLASNTKRERVVFLEGKTELWCGAPFLARREGEVTCALRARTAKFLPRARESFPWMVFVQCQQMFTSIFYKSMCKFIILLWSNVFITRSTIWKNITLVFVLLYYRVLVSSI